MSSINQLHEQWVKHRRRVVTKHVKGQTRLTGLVKESRNG